MNKQQKVEIKPAKGRPMLTWVGKKPLRQAIAYPAQLVETFSLPSPAGRGAGGEGWSDWPKAFPQSGLLFHGDNKDVLATLLANGFRGKVKLVYIDPPFDSGADYVRKVELRGSTVPLEGEGYVLGEQIQYADIWSNDTYLQFMYERLLLLKELLSEEGSIYLHCDWHRNHHLRCLIDEVFGPDHFLSEIVWQRTASHNDPGRYGTIHDLILFYSKGTSYVWNNPKVPQSQEYIDQFFVYAESPTGEIRRIKKGEACPAGWRRFRLGNFASPHPRPNLTYEYKGYKPPANGWKVSIEKMRELDKQGRLYFPESKDSRIQTKSYLDEVAGGKSAPDLWTEMLAIQAQSSEREDYPTQKPEALLERIISASSNPGDIVLDCFLGSGTTTAVAQRLGRHWIGADINKGAIQTTIKRLQGVIQEQAEKAKNENQALPGMEGEEEPPVPAQLGFSVYRVNDYDLQIQHNEAFNLAIEHLGMTRSKTDTFFDGTLGVRLVKIVPFNHPVTALDLEEVKMELGDRPDEARDIVVVGLGKELAVEAWLEDWNKLRRQGEIPNKIEVIELRSDPKYGGLFTHQPAQAKVAFKHTKKGVEITVEDFISPTILERLKQQNKDNPLFQPQIDDWRAMVDSVMIDADYDGKVFNIALADVPEKKNELVEGKYAVEVKQGATVAVKITDMLGEEVLVVQRM
jgi:DNA modification methylase